MIKSSIRTMEEDLAALRKGQAPIAIKPSPPLTSLPGQGGPPLPPKPAISPRIELGKLEKAKTLEPTPPAGLPGQGRQPSVFVPPLPGLAKTFPPPVASHGLGEPSPAVISVPPQRRFNLSSPINLIVALAVLAIAGFSVWFFLFYKPSAPGIGESPTPTPIVTPLATPLPPIETVFTTVDSVSTAVSENFYIAFKDVANVEALAPGEAGLYRIFELETGDRYSLSKFSAGTLIQAPIELIGSLADEDLYITLMRRTDDTIGYGWVIKINDPASAQAALASWETTMSNNLERLFDFDVAKAASMTFLENRIAYNDVAIRYRNFPHPGLTIDYALASAPNGEYYLVFTNSREHIYNVIDRIKAISPGTGEIFGK